MIFYTVIIYNIYVKPAETAVIREHTKISTKTMQF